MFTVSPLPVLCNVSSKRAKIVSVWDVTLFPDP